MRSKGSVSIVVNTGAVLLLLAALVALYLSPRKPASLAASRAPASKPPSAPEIDSQIQ